MNEIRYRSEHVSMMSIKELHYHVTVTQIAALFSDLHVFVVMLKSNVEGNKSLPKF